MNRILAFLLPALCVALLLGTVSCNRTNVHPAPPTKVVKVPVYQTRVVRVPSAPSGPPRTIPGEARGVAGAPGTGSFRAVSE